MEYEIIINSPSRSITLHDYIAVTLIIPLAIGHALGERLAIEGRRYAADLELDAGQVKHSVESGDDADRTRCGLIRIGY